MEFYDDELGGRTTEAHEQLTTLMGNALTCRDKTCISCFRKMPCLAFPSRANIIEITFHFGLMEWLKQFLIDTINDKSRWDFPEADDEYVEGKINKYKNILKQIEKAEHIGNFTYYSI